MATVYHRRPHSETGQPPIDRFLAGGPPTPPSAALLREALLWSAWRTVTKTATVSLHGNAYQVDPALAGRRIELVFDPFDLTTVEVRYHGRTMGQAIPHRIGRHAHPKARPEIVSPPPAPTGIDYLHLIEARHTAELADRLRYADLPDHTPADDTPADHTPADHTPADHTPADHTPADHTELPGQLSIDSAIGQTPADQTGDEAANR